MPTRICLIVLLFLISGCEPVITEEDMARRGFILDDAFERRARELNPTSGVASQSPTQVVPAVEGWWTRSPTVGQSIQYNPDLSDDTTQSVLKMPERGHPAVWTLMLGQRYTLNATDVPVFNVIAEIEIGSGGGIIPVEVDWADGTALSFSANAVTVGARFFVSTPPERLTVTALLGLGDRGSSGIAPTRTHRFQLGTATDTGIIRVPPFAKSVRILGGVDVYDVLNIFQGFTNSTPSATTLDFRLTGADLSPTESIILPGGTRTVRFSYNGGNLFEIVNVVFELQL
jgi:hypothetical protein